MQVASIDSLYLHRLLRLPRGEPALAQVFDVGAVGPQSALVLKEVAVFLAQPLPDAASALGVYVSVGGQQWQFRGYVANSHPSECALPAGVLFVDALVGTRDSVGGQQLVLFGYAAVSWPIRRRPLLLCLYWRAGNSGSLIGHMAINTWAISHSSRLFPRVLV
jgi:hypothetical protein